MADVKPFVISREFNAPRELVYKVHTELHHLEKWLSPEGFETIKADQDFRVGGTYHYGLKGPNGMEMWGKQIYKEIVPQQKLVYIQMFSDKDGGVTRHPMSATWPLEMHVTLTFEDVGGNRGSVRQKTKVTTSWYPINANDTENATFDGARESMNGGFNGTFLKLEKYIAQIYEAGEVSFPSDHEIINIRVFNAPREKVFKAWTDKDQVAQWWGPDGITNSIQEHDLRVGGNWRFTMKGGDGVEYPNHMVFLEIVEPSRIVIQHANQPKFKLTATFEDLGGGKTRMVWHGDFVSKEVWDGVKGFAIEGNKQTITRLALLVER